MRLSSILNIHRASTRLCEVVLGHPELRAFPGFTLPAQVSFEFRPTLTSLPDLLLCIKVLTLKSPSSETPFHLLNEGKTSCCRLPGHLIHPLCQTHHLTVIVSLWTFPATLWAHGGEETVGCFNILWTSAGYPTIQFSPDNNYPELAQTPRVEGSVPQNHPCFRCQLQVWSHLYFWPTSYKSGVPTTPSSGSVIY